jgi:N6-L-threonylcarbamoyladenine synthase
MLLTKLEKAALQYKVKDVGIAGGVSANSALRQSLKTLAAKHQWHCFIPDFEFCTDNAAMIAITGYYKLQKGETGQLDDVPMARMVF